MKKWLVLLAFFPQILVAQINVQIRSGEHEGFTRLVLSVEPETQWQLVETPGEILLEFQELDFEFDTSAIFTRIARTRIATVEGLTGETGTTLRIETTCQCAAKVFVFNRQYLVIDVFAGPPLPEQDNTPVVDAQLSEFEYWQPVQLGDAPKAGVADFFFQPDSIDAEEQILSADKGAQQMRANEPVNSLINTTITRPEGVPDAEMLARITEAQNQLLQQLTRAADQGLIDFVPTKVETLAVNLAAEAPIAEIIEPQVFPLDPDLLRQLSARTAYDDAAASDLADIVNEFAKPQCLPNSDFDMADWRSNAAFSTQIAQLRAEMFGEFDRIEPEITLKLIQLYIAHGLGTEAKAILAEFSEPLQISPLLTDLANIVDGGSWQKNGPVSLGENCGGNHEMWYLSGNVEPSNIIDPQSVLEAFASYPIYIRVLIGPRLSGAFLEAGQSAAADMVLEIIRRSAAPETVPMQMAAANVFESRNQYPEANEIFAKVATTREYQSDDAIIALAQGALDSDAGIPESMLTDLETIVFENRGSPTGATARLLEIRVAARIHGLGKALEMLAFDIDAQPGDISALTLVATEIMENQSAEETGYLSYVETVIRYSSLLPSDATADAARTKIATEMILIGLPDIALEILAPSLSRNNPTAQLMAARAYLAQFKPELALQAVARQDSRAASKIKISAHILAQDNVAIAEILNDPENIELLTPELAWRVGNWQNVQQGGERTAMAAYMLGTSQPLADMPLADLSNEAAFLTEVRINQPPNLRRARDLLAVNRASRSFIEGFLAAE